jgi:hypothetical protein
LTATRRYAIRRHNTGIRRAASIEEPDGHVGHRPRGRTVARLGRWSRGILLERCLSVLEELLMITSSLLKSSKFSKRSFAPVVEG